MYEDVRAFCLFMGYARSGHSLIGALLDAHPDAVIAHEGKIFEYDDRNVPTGQLCHASRQGLIDGLVGLSSRQATKGRRGTRLIGGVAQRTSYEVPGAHQGTYDRLFVVGNKAGQESPLVWQINPGVFDALEDLADAPVRFLHVYRNPWDNIASMTRVHGEKAIRRYFRRARIIRQFRAEAVRPILDVRFESVVAEPLEELRTILGFYGLDAPDDLLRACASIIDSEPNPSRHTREWGPEDIRAVAESMRDFEWLHGYRDRPD